MDDPVKKRLSITTLFLRQYLTHGFDKKKGTRLTIKGCTEIYHTLDYFNQKLRQDVKGTKVSSLYHPTTLWKRYIYIMYRTWCLINKKSSGLILSSVQLPEIKDVYYLHKNNNKSMNQQVSPLIWQKFTNFDLLNQLK